MNIFDLSHLEEVVAEAPSILGGGTTIDDLVKKLLKDSKVKVKAVTINTKTGTVTTKVASGTTSTGEKIKTASSTSTLK